MFNVCVLCMQIQSIIVFVKIIVHLQSLIKCVSSKSAVMAMKALVNVQSNLSMKKYATKCMHSGFKV